MILLRRHGVRRAFSRSGWAGVQNILLLKLDCVIKKTRTLFQIATLPAMSWRGFENKSYEGSAAMLGANLVPMTFGDGCVRKVLLNVECDTVCTVLVCCGALHSDMPPVFG